MKSLTMDFYLLLLRGGIVRPTPFYLLVGEITITLNDVPSLLHIPIVSGFYSYPHTSKEVTIALLMELLGLD